MVYPPSLSTIKEPGPLDAVLSLSCAFVSSRLRLVILAGHTCGSARRRERTTAILVNGAITQFVFYEAIAGLRIGMRITPPADYGATVQVERAK